MESSKKDGLDKKGKLFGINGALEERGPNTINASTHHKINWALHDLSKEGFDLPKGKEFSFISSDYVGGTNNNLFVHSSETGEKKYVIKLFRSGKNEPGAATRERDSYTLMCNFLGPKNDHPNLLLPREISANTQENYRVTEYVPHEDLNYFKAPNYLDLLLEYTTVCYGIKRNESNERYVNFTAEGASPRPYDLYLKYLNGIQQVFDTINSGQKDSYPHTDHTKNPPETTIIEDIDGEPDNLSLMKEFDIEKRLADFEARIISSIPLAILHSETPQSKFAFNHRDISPNNTLITTKDGQADKMYLVDFEEAGWDSELMPISLWYTHPKVVSSLSEEARVKFVRDFANSVDLSREDREELKARIGLARLLRASTLLRGALPEKRRPRFRAYDKQYFSLKALLRMHIFEPLDKELDKSTAPIDL